MKRALIIPYFGAFNNYFFLWLESAKRNASIDFLIFTDIEIDYTFPENIKIIKKTLSQVKNEFEKKLGCSITLKHPYKLCDYKPYYGFIFEEYLSNYDFWGYCDCDLIFGDVDHFLTKDIFDMHDKVLRRGHLSFIRNTKEINRNFLKYDTYKLVIKAPCIFGYDESIYGYHNGFSGELIEQGYRFYENDSVIGDIDFRHFPFRVVTSSDANCVFRYCNGKIYKICKTGKGYAQEEMMYVHLQKRKMKVSEISNTNDYLIIPNEFISFDESLLMTSSFWEKVSTERKDYFDFHQEKNNNRKRDLQRFFYEPHKFKSLKYRFTGK